MQKENLGAAERIIQTALAYSDHMVHNRPGLVIADPQSAVGLTWRPVTHRVVEDRKVVFCLDRVKKRSVRTEIGVLREHDRAIVDEAGKGVGEYRPARPFPGKGPKGPAGGPPAASSPMSRHCSRWTPASSISLTAISTASSPPM